MSRTYRTLLRLCLVSVVFWAMISNVTAQEQPNLSGTVTVTATSAAVGIGWSWGNGTLTLLNGKQHHFKVSGLDVVAVGFKQATAVGKVYNLKNIKDFAGTYGKYSVNPSQEVSRRTQQHRVEREGATCSCLSFGVHRYTAIEPSVCG